MASLGEVRDAFKAVLQDAIDGVFVYDTVHAALQLPAILVEPDPNDGAILVGNGFSARDQKWSFVLTILLRFDVADVRQDRLDALLSGVGDQSIQQAIKANQSLGLEGVTVTPEKIYGYGGVLKLNDQQYLGAHMRVQVYIDNS